MKELTIIVTVKQVPDTAEVRIDPETNSLMREGVPSIINPEDLNAVEAALSLKEQYGGTVTAVTMGPPQAQEVLEEVVAMGVDRAVLLTDRAFAGSDTLVTAFTLSRGIMKLGTFDLIICGRQAIDGDTAQVGPQVASFLDLPQVTYADRIEIVDDCAHVQRSLEDCTELVKVCLPALVTVLGGINRPRHPSLYNIEKACDETCVSIMGAGDLKVPASMLGLNASPTGVKKIFEPERTTECRYLSGDEKEMARTLINHLKDQSIL